MTGQRIGYARVSTRQQTGDTQADDLAAAGCARVFFDRGVSGKHARRPQWDACRDHLRPGDTLVVTRLSRLGRSIANLIEIANWLRERDIALVLIHEGIDTSTIAGRLLYNMLAAVGEFHRELIVEGTLEGLAAARARGRVGGRKRKLSPALQAAVVRAYRDGDQTVEDIARDFQVSRQTVYRYLDWADREAANAR